MTDRERWGFLDALRGIAVAGILFVNIPDLVDLGVDVPPGSDVEDREPLDYLVQTRFIPIFTVLFGMSLVFVLRSARVRGRRAWLAVLLRLLSLFGIGLLHALIFSGDILRAYAVSGVLLLPIILLTPRLLQLVVGLAAVIAAYALAGGGLAATPGLMLTGAALTAYGAPRALETGALPVRWTFSAACVLLVPALYWQSTDPGDPRFSTAGSVAGLVMATWYVCGLSLLWTTRVRRVIAAFFDPLGRMALSNYVGGSLIVYAVAQVIDFRSMISAAPTSALATVILLMQSLVSRLWLRYFAQGPLEWVWRSLTWREPQALRRRPQPGAVLAPPRSDR
ncbi:MAG TPA: DUF418 domain-containing protein [Propionibacteriaceae bacterium]|nr:DUF418 domain-containing protein [Propionibacteriaceae bacterium]